MTIIGSSARALRRARSVTVSPLAIVASIAILVLRHPNNHGRRLRTLFRAGLALLWFRCTGIPVLAPLGRHSQLLTRPRLFNSVTAAPWYGNPPDFFATELLGTILRDGDLFVDVGANVGVYTLLAIEAGANVIAIEPSSDAVELLSTNVSLNGCADRVRIHQVAAGAQQEHGLLTLGTDVLNHIVDEFEAQSPSDASVFWTRRATGTERITIEPLDAIVGDQFVAAMKIDVEGKEFEVLLGAEHLLQNARIGYLQIENNDTSLLLYGRSNQRVWDHLRSFGYELFGLGPNGALLREGPIPTSAEVVAVAPGDFFEGRRLAARVKRR